MARLPLLLAGSVGWFSQRFQIFDQIVLLRGRPCRRHPMLSERLPPPDDLAALAEASAEKGPPQGSEVI